MKHRSSASIVSGLFGLLSLPVLADLYVTNFNGASNTEANGVWRNFTTSSDLSTKVSLTQAGGIIRPQDGTSTESRFDDSFPWQDAPAPFSINFFEPNFTGDYVNILVDGGSTVPVTISFNAEVVDPTLYFTDVDTQTTLVFTNSFTITGESGNMQKSGNTVTTDGTTVPFLDEETFGSLKFSGTFTELKFTIVNDGSDPTNDLDRTGFCVSTETAPVPLTSGSGPELEISVDGDDVIIDWGSPGAIDQLQRLDSNQNWVEVSEANPAGSSNYVGSRMMFGPAGAFRATYSP